MRTVLFSHVEMCACCKTCRVVPLLKMLQTFGDVATYRFWFRSSWIQFLSQNHNFDAVHFHCKPADRTSLKSHFMCVLVPAAWCHSKNKFDRNMNYGCYVQVLFLGPLTLHYLDGVFQLYLGKLDVYITCHFYCSCYV